MALVQGIETDINVRWESGMDHHPEASEIVSALAELDFKVGGDSFCIKTGGDGDNGETMMYLLSIYFEARDKGIPLADVIAATVKSA
jgi:hypothetical protein